MADDMGAENKMIDPAEFQKAMANIAERSQRLVSDFIARQSTETAHPHTNLDPLNLGSAFLEMTARMMSNPARIIEANINLWQSYMQLWQNTAMRMMGEEAKPVATPDETDRRFKDEMWQENELFDYIKQSYLLSARYLQGLVHSTEGLDEHTLHKVDFYTRQFVDALAPSNFVLTNPEVLRTTIETGGENLVKGLNNLLTDLERGKGKLSISMTDYDAFKVGENIAVTEGKVVMQNDLMQLIQYTPTTPNVAKRPLLIVPPWINKYYILDLRPRNSLVKWAVDQGHTVYMISWVNPCSELAAKSFEDYMFEGPLAAMDAIEKAIGEKDVNMVGYCLGGTLTVCTLAYLAAKKQKRVKSATLLTTLTDFKEPGELGVFIDEEQLTNIEQMMGETGVLDGRDMAMTFNMLRANDLIWSFVINNYLLGKDPFPFDLLYWNSDCTSMPSAMHSFYLRKMYQQNKLIEPGGITLGGVALDLRKIDVPIYMLSTREDHIAPWTSTFSLTRIAKAPIKFVLSASGHIAGVVNPPVANKYCYWHNPAKESDTDAWLQGATQYNGSWWVDWNNWLVDHRGGDVEARIPGQGGLPAIEDAPGAYVKVRAI